MKHERKYPIEQSDIDAAVEKIRLRNERKESQARKVQLAPRREILPLGQAIKRLGNDEVFNRVDVGKYDKND